MAQAYSNPKRANDPHALPDVEVFFADAGELGDVSDGEKNEAGWYYWFCFPGCLPDSDPEGPFGSEAEALDECQMQRWLSLSEDDDDE